MAKLQFLYSNIWERNLAYKIVHKCPILAIKISKTKKIGEIEISISYILSYNWLKAKIIIISELDLRTFYNDYSFV